MISRRLWLGFLLLGLCAGTVPAMAQVPTIPKISGLPQLLEAVTSDRPAHDPRDGGPEVQRRLERAQDPA